MEILFLGTSGAGITPTRNLPSIIINRSILFDCGEGCLGALYKHNIPLEQIKAIFISHVHADHVLGLISILYKAAFYTPFSTNPLIERISCPIYVPTGAKENILQLIKATFSTFENVKYLVQLIELPDTSFEPITIETDGSKVKIDWMPSIHVPKCLTFRMNRKVVITGDTGFNPDLKEFAQKVELLIHESAVNDTMEILAAKVRHSTPSQAATIAKQAKVGRLILYHIPDLPPDAELNFISQAKQIFQATSIAHDSDIIQI
jgi:ribonuclease Z